MVSISVCCPSCPMTNVLSVIVKVLLATISRIIGIGFNIILRYLENLGLVQDLAACIQVAFDTRTKRMLLTMSSAMNIPTVSTELFTKFQVRFY